MKCSLGISNFLEEISSLSHSIVFLYFSALITEESFLISPCYSLELCIQIGISFLFSFAFSSLLSTAIGIELLIAKFRLKLKKVGKTTRLFRYDLNKTQLMIIQWEWQIQGIRSDRVPDELWTEVCDIVQEAVIKTIPKKKKCKMAVWGGLTNSCEKKRRESREEKERYTHLNAEFQRTAGEIRKPASVISEKK